MTHASLFSGIGGAELAAIWMGWNNLFHCEINSFGRKILDYYFKESKSYEDITKTDFREWRGKVDVLTGGFPCQPFSQAGKRKGDTDDRYLWPQMLRAISEIRPTWVVGENVAGIVSMVESCEEIKVGCTDDIFEENNIYRKEQEFTIERICKDFEREGYSVQPIVIPACSIGAPHRRDRVWFIAHTYCIGSDRSGAESNREKNNPKVWTDILGKIKGHGDKWTVTNTECSRGSKIYNENKSKKSDGNGSNCASDERITTNTIYAGNTTQQNEVDTNEPEKMRRGEPQSEFARYVSERSAADTNRNRFFGCDGKDEKQSSKRWVYALDDAQQVGFKRGKYTKQDWSNFPTQSPICCGNDGISNRLDGITFPKWRAESIKAYGNAWVPQVAYEIFKAISNSNQ